MSSNILKLVSATSCFLFLAIANAGTYSLISGDASLVAGTGSGVSWSVTSNSFTAVIQQSATAMFGMGAYNTGAIQGTVKWTVDWAPAYPGEPVPDHVLVTLDGYGHEYALAQLGPTGSGGDALADLAGGFSIWQAHQAGSPGSTSGGSTLTDADHGNFFSGTGGFTLFSPGHYRSTIDFSVNDGAAENVTVGMHYFVQKASVDLYNKFTITKIDGQTM